ncbi:hypothetical protein [Stenoxybacter acetivorans]|nr:hypothetical protein [Stenoxybacter acetivorans]
MNIYKKPVYCRISVKKQGGFAQKNVYISDLAAAHCVSSPTLYQVLKESV